MVEAMVNAFVIHKQAFIAKNNRPIDEVYERETKVKTSPLQI